MHENLTSNYKKTSVDTINTINNDACSIIQNMQLEQKIKKMHCIPFFSSIEDHKESFLNKVENRLLNPIKSDLDKISKTILDSINKSIASKTLLKQIPNIIKKRLNNRSSKEENYLEIKNEYDLIMTKCGYDDKLKFKYSEQKPKTNLKSKRKRNVIW